MTNNFFIFSVFLTLSLLLSAMATFLGHKERHQTVLLQTQLQTLQTVLNHLPVTVWQLNQQGIVQIAFGQLHSFGNTAYPLTGSSIFTLYQALPDFLQDIQEALARRINHKPLTIAKNQEYYDVYYQFITDTDLLVIAYNVTQSLKKEQVYVQQLKYHETLFRHATEGFCIIKTNGIIYSVNPTFCQLIGYTKDELQGNSIHLFIDVEMNSEQFPSQWVGKIRHKQGHLVSVLINHFLFKNYEDSSQESLIVNFIKDLTAYKQIEADLHQVRETLETTQRTKSTFLNAINQGIRTPLNNIIGTTELLLKSPIEPRQQRYSIETIRESSENLLNFFNDILAFSRIETGQLNLELSAIDVHALIEDLLGQAALATQRKDLIFICQFSFFATYLLKGDIDRLRQVVNNLLNYAIKSTEQGCILLQVGLLEETEQAVKLHIELNSHGVINTSVLDNLFKSVATADDATQYSIENISIIVARHLIDVMGGTFSFYHQTEDQSTLWFDIVLQKMNCPNTTLGTAEQRANLHNRRVLVAEPHPLYRQFITEQLRLWHLQVDCVSSATECLDSLLDAVALRQAYDVVIIDSCLPYLQGMSLSQIIHANTQVNQIPLIILHPAKQDYPQLSIPNEYNLQKPVMPSKLLQHLFTSILNKADTMNTGTAFLSAHEKHVLLAEDNIINQEVMKDMLLQLHCQVTVVNNGEEVLVALNAQNYDLIFMDCQMPKMDGYQATESIRQQEKKLKTDSHIPIIAVTANAINGARERCFISGMDDYLSKPINSHDLERMLTRYCGLSYFFTEKTSPLVINDVIDDKLMASSNEAYSPHLLSINTQEEIISLSMIETMRQDMQKRGINWLIDLFLTEFPRYQAVVHEAILLLDKDMFYQAVHKLKGGAASVGSISLVNFCKQLEELSKCDNLDEAAEQVEKYLAIECSLLEMALEEEKKKGK
ncbi:response regulator [Beggiatoa leptomitoformis]|uniref:response regulator n=1 Tax=Beggiatoa leptomitoformis TaxID=288004 RepID=UPI00137549E1|nr:response regulator [Beggiatoa leptomitoformis]